MLDPLIRLPEYRASTGRRATPITLIGGFLGAGKTTLLNSLLTQASGRRFGVLVNDFGELNIDARLVVNVEGQRVELANGRVCCTIRDDLVAGVAQMLDADDPPEQILIETSGVSDPLNIMFTFVASSLRDRAFLENVVTVVDALHVAEARAHEYALLFDRQVQAAYVVVLNKTALAGEEKAARARATIEQLMPGAHVLETENGSVPLPLLLGDARLQDGLFRPVPETNDSPHPFVSVAYRSPHPLRRADFEALLAELRGAAFRAKGVVRFQHYPIPTLFQMVGSYRAFSDAAAWGGVEPHTELVFIGSPRTLARERVLAGLAACEARAP
jgi:G3E family GTPase